MNDGMGNSVEAFKFLICTYFGVTSLIAVGVVPGRAVELQLVRSGRRRRRRGGRRCPHIDYRSRGASHFAGRVLHNTYIIHTGLFIRSEKTLNHELRCSIDCAIVY